MRKIPTLSTARRYVVAGSFLVLLLGQAFLGFQQSAELLTRGHNGWNTAAYQQSARNSLRFGLLFPVQYYTGIATPAATQSYSHAPLALHLHTTLSVYLFGDNEASVRGVSAVHGVLALLALFFVTRRLWGDAHALITCLFYVALPINGIYLNMSNHVSGFVAWILVTFYCYFRFHDAREAEQYGHEAALSARKWFIALCAAYFMAAAWDWVSNYSALAVALHLLYSGAKRRERVNGRFIPGLKDFGFAAAFSAVVLGFLALHALLVELYAGGLSELLATFNRRTQVDPEVWAYHIRTVPEYMFSWPVLILAASWMLALGWRFARGKVRPRDLMTFSLAYGGITHYLLFRESAIVHEYWAWHSLPFVALACSSASLWVTRALALLGRRGLGRMVPASRAHYGTGLALIVLPFLYPFVARVIDIVPAGRSVAGSMWFVGPVRNPTPSPYTSTRVELQFAKQVRAWTDRDTGVLRHRSLDALTESPRWPITTDREVRDVANIPLPPYPQGPGSWVFVADRRAFSPAKLVELASLHPYYQYGNYFMLDLRSERIDVRIWTLRTMPMNALHWFWVSPFDLPVVGFVSPSDEARTLARVRAVLLGSLGDADHTESSL